MTTPATVRLTQAEIGPRQFEVLEHGRRYRLAVPGASATFEIDRARWSTWGELSGELIVTTSLLGTEAVNGGVLSQASFNLSRAEERTKRSTLLARQSRAPEVPWHELIEEFCQRVLSAERTGQPSVDLRNVPKAAADAEIDCHGFKFPARHPSIGFGDGGGLKSYIGLYAAGSLAYAGLRVGFFDWELAAEDHRDRLERLFGDEMPEIRYARCDRPLVHDLDRLRRIVTEDRLDFVVLDSIAFASDGPPEAAEVAGRYFQSLRQLRVGTFNLAHVTKAETGDQRPFGSAFWHNGARATWFVKPADNMPDSRIVSVGLFPRKRNLGALPAAWALEFEFDDERTHVRRVDVGAVADLADRLPIRQRMVKLLRRGALAPDLVADELQADLETVKRTARRYKDQFVVLQGGRLGLVERRA